MSTYDFLGGMSEGAGLVLLKVALPLILLAVLLFAVAILLRKILPPSKKPYSYGFKPQIMTKSEEECFRVLSSLVGDTYYVFPQIHLPNLLDHRANDQRWGAFRHIDAKSVDFVLCDKATLSTRLAIELDDWSHSLQKRQERDREVGRMLEEAGLPLLRIVKSDVQNPEVLRGKVAHAMEPVP